jgi:hypothetical protein
MHRERAKQLMQANLSRNKIADEYRRLTSLFNVEFTSFERKRYANLSRAPNKVREKNLTFPQNVRVQPCIRPLNAAVLAAGPDVIR